MTCNKTMRAIISSAILDKCELQQIHQYCRDKHVNTSIEFTLDFLFRYLEYAYDKATTKDEHLANMADIISGPQSTFYARVFIKVSAIYFEEEFSKRNKEHIIFPKRNEKFIMDYFNFPSTKLALAWGNLFVAHCDRYIDDDISFLMKCLASGYGCTSSAAKNKILLLGEGEDTAACDTWNKVLRGNKISDSSSSLPLLKSAASILRPVLL